MNKAHQWSYLSACMFLFIVGFSSISVVRADPSSSPQPPVTVMKKSEIPASVIKDIKRVHPGMTRADLDWLFTPDGGLFTITPRSYIYRYAGATLTATDAAGKPILDKVTHRPVMYAQAIKIDVKFKPAKGRDWAMLTEDKTGRQYISADGRSDDVIVSISDPYVGFENDN